MPFDGWQASCAAFLSNAEGYFPYAVAFREASLSIVLNEFFFFFLAFLQLIQREAFFLSCLYISCIIQICFLKAQAISGREVYDSMSEELRPALSIDSHSCLASLVRRGIVIRGSGKRFSNWKWTRKKKEGRGNSWGLHERLCLFVVEMDLDWLGVGCGVMLLGWLSGGLEMMNVQMFLCDDSSILMMESHESENNHHDTVSTCARWCWYESLSVLIWVSLKLALEKGVMPAT